MLLWYLGAAVAVGGALVAAVIDIRMREIPNTLTLGMMAAGAALSTIRILTGDPWLLVAPPAALAIALSWLLWRGGLFGGGDAKLMMAVVLLLPLYPSGLSFIPTFFMMLGVAAFIHFFVFGLVVLLRQRRVAATAAFGAVPVAGALAAFFVTRRVLPWPHLAALLALAVAADLVSPLLPYRRHVKVDEELEGMLLAETIGLRDGKVARVPQPPSLLRRVVHGSPEMDEVIASPGHLGVQPGEIDRLRALVDEVAVYPAFPFAPLILAALLLSLAFGNVIPM